MSDGINGEKSLLLCILGPVCVETSSRPKIKIKKSQPRKKVFKTTGCARCQHNLSTSRFYTKFLKGLSEKVGTLSGVILESWNHLGEKLKKNVVILAEVSVPSF